MPQDKDNGKRGAARPEYEVAYYTKELGRNLQRKLLRERFAAFSDKEPQQPAHGDDARSETADPPPQADRAG